jgi:hypothetical protein
LGKNKTMSTLKLFPILHGKVFHAIPWDAIAPFEEQAHSNHSQTLTRLAERGGLSTAEAVAVMQSKGWLDRWNCWRLTPEQSEEAEAQLLTIISEHWNKRAKL